MEWISLEDSPYSKQVVPGVEVLATDGQGSYLVGMVYGTHDGHSSGYYFECVDGLQSLSPITHYTLLTPPKNNNQ